jgi:type I restriction enzyme M protein
MAEQLAGRDLQEKIIDLLNNMPPTLFKSAQDFEKALEQSLGDIIQKIPAAVRKAITFALSEADETAQVCTDNKSNTLASPDLRDTENVPLGEDIQTYFEREVLPHVPDAWINTSVIDHKDQQIGKVGYEISFNRCFYKYQPPRPLEDIQSEIEKLQQEILDLQGGLF